MGKSEQVTSYQKLHASTIIERMRWIQQMLSNLQALPQESYDEFAIDHRTSAAAESYLRRGLEALFDLGRHILAKGFSLAPEGYLEVAHELLTVGILTPEESSQLHIIAEFLYRMVYDTCDVEPQELYEFCTKELDRIVQITDTIKIWINEHPDRVDQSI
jgi:uncharacterized protein YutE (UPF0331/DUF86 family)